MKIERGGSCNTNNIIYAAECRKHRKLNIGSHRSDIKKLISKTCDGDVKGTELSEHFLLPHICQKTEEFEF